MADLRERQTQLMRSVDRAIDNFRKIGKKNLNPAKIRNRISALKDIWAQVQNGHFALLAATPAADRSTDDYFRESQYEACEDAYQAASDYMAECLEELDPYVNPNQSFESGHHPLGSSAFSLSHLPPITLPPFNGNYEEWESFRDRFTSLIINNKDLSNFSRMHFLVSCLKDRALDCVKDINVTADNFAIAWNTLNTRLENKRRLINVHMSTLLNLPAVARESAAELQTLRDKINTAVAALSKLNRSPEELWSDILVNLGSLKLDTVTRKAWNLKYSEERTPPAYEDFSKFLDNRIRALEEWKLPPSPADKSKPSSVQKINNAAASAQSPPQCSLCKLKHQFSACPQFVSRSPSQRRDLVRKENRCFNCMRKGHAVQACSSKFTCRLCQRKHHTTLHLDSDSQPKALDVVPTSHPSQSDTTTKEEVNSLFTSSNATARVHVLLATTWITVGSSSGRSVTVRALLDQGSEMTFITEKLAQCLRLKRICLPTTISAVGCVNAGTYRSAATITISPRDRTTPAFSTTALILKSLTSYIPPRVETELTLSHLADLPWADSDPMSTDPIQILVGADLYGELILDGLRKGATGRPIAQNTVLGWIISGPMASSLVSSHTSSSPLSSTPPFVTSHFCSQGESLEAELRRFWEVEEIPRSSILSPADEQCEEHFRQTHSRCPDGRYMVRLPFKTGPPINIGHSRAIADKCLQRLTRRLQRNPEQQKEYSDFLREYEKLGHMQEVPRSQTDNAQNVYIPHHPVIREDSVTTHLRVVFNASCLTANGSSLNDHLLTGPKLQQDLPAVLLQWRQSRYVYTADITKMYRQICVDPRDGNYQRILWTLKPSDIPREYVLLTVTYGMISAPFLALRVLIQLVTDEGHKFPLAVIILQRKWYADDALFGDDDPIRLRQSRDQLQALLRLGGFELRKWASNSSELLSDIDPANHGLACNKNLQDDERVKVLGISWAPSQDHFQFCVSLDPKLPRTKRAILSTIAKLFDPLGWATPIIVTAKIFMQRLWRLNLNWDDDISSDDSTRWQSIYTNLEALNRLQIPRWTGYGSDTIRCELHGFADASTSAYAAVVYIKVETSSGQIVVSLLTSKSKVAPVKPVTVPRLELLAAVLLARLIQFVRRSIVLKDSDCFCWIDAKIVLAWLSQHPSKWKTFIANRVHEVQSLLPHVSWRHVPTTDNPADCASRGLLGHELLDHALWWKGPPWLHLPQRHWPREDSTDLYETELEQKPVVCQVATPVPSWDLDKRFSSWPKLIRVTALIFRFVNHCRRIKRNGLPSPSPGLTLSTDECHQAKVFWLKSIQATSFSDEIKVLSAQQPLARKSSLLSLYSFMDQDGLLRVGGRLKHAPIPDRTKYPIILSAHPLVSLIIRHAHVRSLHAGPQLTLLTLRQEYWILQARKIVRSLIHKCVTCAREKAVAPQQLMGDLPSLRVSPPTRSFLHCRLDYAGPVQIRTSGGRGIKSCKAYIALFVCLATRAIHLELVGSYSTSSFLDAYTRFCARRGLPASMHSDNGTTFVGADREITAAYKAAVSDPNFLNSTATDHTQWHFLPPSAPHFGGLWEAGVKSVKYHLRRVIKNYTLTFEEFSTLLCKIEACLNSRPLAPLRDDPHEYETLTPGHFLIGSAITVSPSPSLLTLNENRLSRWQLVRQIAERFWKLWQSDYINTLQQRVKWRRIQPPIQIGQLVLLRNNALPPCKWELGRVTQCHPGTDGLTRVVTVKTATSEYKRPIVKLCVLPIDIEGV